MSRIPGKFDELGQLAAALCEGDLTPEGAARLEHLAGESAEAREYLLDYLWLHGELCWQFGRAQAATVEAETMEAELPRVERRAAAPAMPGRVVAARRRTLRLAAVAAGVLIAVALGAAGVYRWTSGRNASALPSMVARLSGSAAAEWSEDGVLKEAEGVAAGQQLVLRAGLAELTFDNGARVVLQGPAEFEVISSNLGRLSYGRLTAHVPPEALGFTICTPQATVVDLGTEFGVAVSKGMQGKEGARSTVEVFGGRVEVWPGDGAKAGGSRNVLRAGEALRVTTAAPGKDHAPRVERISGGTLPFARSLGSSLARLQSLVAGDPSLLHYYPFHGAAVEERFRDHKGQLHLSEVAMRDGSGGGALNPTAPGFAPDSNAVRSFRAPHSGNTRGVALQSQTAFHPPHAMTIELLLRFDRPAGNLEGLIASAVATRADRDRCGFLLAATESGRLAHLLDGRAPWLESSLELVSGHWYYVATTLEGVEAETRINTYAADLTAAPHELKRVIQDQLTPGTPPAGRLGIGKGFDGDNADAYPWPGALAEIAVYGAVLDAAVLRAHLEALVGTPIEAGPQPGK